MLHYNAGDAGDSVQFLGGEDPLEEEMATHSSILTWKIPWTANPGGATTHGVTKESDMTTTKEQTTTEALNNLAIVSVR